MSSSAWRSPTHALPAKTTQAPPWLVKLLTPFIARNVAREMQKKYAGLGAAEIAEKMRAEIHSGLDPVESAKPLSAWLLVAANLIPLYAVLFWHWQVFPLLVLRSEEHTSELQSHSDL